MKVAIILGTRPEAIKLAPLIKECRDEGGLEVSVISTGQHREMLAPIFYDFGIVPEVDLDLFSHALPVHDQVSRAVQRIGETLSDLSPAVTLVQGDTSATLAGAIASYSLKIPVVHVEAGLRTRDIYAPFPEEGNRRMVSAIADLHLAATQDAAINLRNEGVAPDRIVVTGNTGIDSLAHYSSRGRALPQAIEEFLSQGGQTALVTVHRREAWGEGLHGIAAALDRLTDRFADMRFVLPMHRNPIVREPLLDRLGGNDRALLIEPLDYLDFVAVMNRVDFIMTDSGGVQEEAPFLGKPVFVLRDTTERMEGVEAGASVLAGTDEIEIFNCVSSVLEHPDDFNRMSIRRTLYGDGSASRKIVRELAERYGS